MVLVILLFFCYTINSGGSMKKVFLIIFLVLLGIFSYIFYTYYESKYYEQILNNIEESFNINKYSIFGTHFNIEGCINKKLDNPTLVLKNKKEEIDLDSIFYEEETSTCFYINKLYNKGIYLDELPLGNYLLLVKDSEKYYTLNNNTNNSNLEYYTITKNDSNKKINIDFNIYDKKGYVKFVIKNEKLPEDVYDVSIDPGHGGKDPGAIGYLNNNEYHESDLTLKVSLLLKKELEKLGLKVNITRDSDIYLTPYGEGGRALIANDYNTKYSFSIHLNSDYGVMEYGGTEIYTSNDIDLTLARLFAKNLSSVVGYSGNPNFKLEDGVYYKYFRNKDIKESNESMKEEELEPYNITLNCPYMYMIRELGGINTYAYVDGRSSSHGFNKHYNSIKTTEPYLLELAYINYPSDLSKVLNHTEDFSKAISKSIKEYLNIS